MCQLLESAPEAPIVRVMVAMGGYAPNSMKFRTIPPALHRYS